MLDNTGLAGGGLGSISAKFDCSASTLNERVKRAEVDRGERAGITTEMAEQLNALERENRELRQANEILRKASACFAPPAEDRRGSQNRAEGAALDRPLKR